LIVSDSVCAVDELDVRQDNSLDEANNKQSVEYDR
jgi:hypothetical protein